MSEFTPGPWKADGSAIYWLGSASRDQWLVVHVGPERAQPSPEVEANARLIAAAPDMYTLLKAYNEVESLTGFDVGVLLERTAELLREIEGRS